MPHYYYFDRTVDSDRVLPELHSVQDKASLHAVISLRECVASVETGGAIAWYENPADSEDEADVACGRLGHRYIMRFAGLVDFVIDLNDREILYLAGKDCPEATLHHMLLDQALPRFIGQQGHLVLHASMVCVGNNALGFIGRSGWGKSTLAASFTADRTEVSGDDALLLGLDDTGRPWCSPAYNGARLWPDSIEAVFKEYPDSRGVAHYSAKQRIDGLPLLRARNSRHPLRALFLLNDPDTAPAGGVQITRLEGSQPLMAILKRCFLLDSQDMAVSRRLWLEVGSLMRAGLPVYQLNYPREFESLPALRTQILETLPAVDAGLAAQIL
jgi:hypothetical protein